jgi:Fe-S-cluster containining protein
MPALVARIRSMPEDERGRLLARVRGWIFSMHAAGIEPYGGEPDAQTLRAYFRLSIPCPLLDRERQECTVYEDRPLACRGHHVIDVTAEACKGGLAPGALPCVNVDALCTAVGQKVLLQQAKGLPADAPVVIKLGKLGTMLMVSLRKEGLMENL